MENAYGIGITNRFGCFLRGASSDGEEDPTDEVLKSSDLQPKPPKAKTAEKENHANKPEAHNRVNANNAQAARKGIRDANQSKGNEKGVRIAASEGQKSNRGPRPERGVNKFSSEEDREERNNRRNRDDGNRGEGEFGERRGRGGGAGFRGERRGGGGGGPRGGGGGGRGGPRKREFDRQSGSDKSGVKSIDKREGGGSRNWGTYKDEIDVDSTLNQTAGDEAEKAEKDIDDKNEEKGDGDDIANGPPEPKTMTLEEWKAAQARQKPVFNLRKAGEGEDQSQWQNLTLKKKEKVDQDEDEYEEEEEYDYPGQRAGRQKQILEIDFRFADSRRGGGAPGERRGGRGRSSAPSERGGGAATAAGVGGGERGGRGGGAGGPPRGFRREGGGFRGGRGGRDDRPTRQAAPRVDDVNDFPSLG